MISIVPILVTEYLVRGIRLLDFPFTLIVQSTIPSMNNIVLFFFCFRRKQGHFVVYDHSFIGEKKHEFYLGFTRKKKTLTWVKTIFKVVTIHSLAGVSIYLERLLILNISSFDETNHKKCQCNKWICKSKSPLTHIRLLFLILICLSNILKNTFIKWAPYFCFITLLSKNIYSRYTFTWIPRHLKNSSFNHIFVPLNFLFALFINAASSSFYERLTD